MRKLKYKLQKWCLLKDDACGIVVLITAIATVFTVGYWVLKGTHGN